jgi:hypothetical protein
MTSKIRTINLHSSVRVLGFVLKYRKIVVGKGNPLSNNLLVEILFQRRCGPM